MKKPIVLAAMVLVLGLCAPAIAGHVFDGSQKVDFLFAQTASDAEFDGERLILKNVPFTVYFSDRPHRIYGHLPNAKFAAIWRKHQPDSFKEDPPNAALSPGGDGQPVVVEILDEPRVEGKSVTYRIKVLTGELPRKLGSVSLFVDLQTCNLSNFCL